MPLDWMEVEKSVKKGQSERGGGGRRLMLVNGETAEIRFIGLEKTKNPEPFIFKQHYDVKTKRYLVCAEDHAKAGEHEGCVACAVAKGQRGKDARLKSPQRLYAVSVFDPRKYHFLENRPKGEQYEPCADDDSCKFCRRNVERRINGVRYWSMAENLILQLKNFERDVLGKKCGNCGTGKIKVTGYECPVCEEEMEPDDPSEEIRCLSCEKEAGKKPVLRKPKEIVSCRSCGPKGRRLTLADAWVTVSRSGERQKTTYNLGVGEVEEFDPEPFLKEFPGLKKIKPINFWESPDFDPLSAGEQAAVLGVRNPFGGKGGGLGEDDDDDEDDDVEDRPRKKKRSVDDDDDEDDDPPKKKRRPVDDDEDDEDDVPRKKKKRPVDDDDDDDDLF